MTQLGNKMGLSGHTCMYLCGTGHMTICLCLAHVKFSLLPAHHFTSLTSSFLPPLIFLPPTSFSLSFSSLSSSFHSAFTQPSLSLLSVLKSLQVFGVLFEHGVSVLCCLLSLSLTSSSPLKLSLYLLKPILVSSTSSHSFFLSLFSSLCPSHSLSLPLTLPLTLPSVSHPSPFTLHPLSSLPPSL